MGALDIRFDPADITDCEKVLIAVKMLTELHHGKKAAQRLLLSATDSNRQIQRNANLRLMAAYISGQTSAKQCARELAEKTSRCPGTAVMVAAAQIPRR